MKTQPQKGYHEHLYSLEEKQESDISPLWQVLQVMFFICSIFFGFAICLSFGPVMVAMGTNCILFAKLEFHVNHTKYPDGRDIKNLTSEFFSGYCDTVIYLPILTSTYGCLFLVMFVYCGRGGAGNQNMPETWRIIIPTIVFNLVSFSCAIVSAWFFHAGLREFLKGIAKAWGEEKVSLSDIGELHLEGQHVGERIIGYLAVTKHIVWMHLSFWGLNFFWIFLRCIFSVDFHLVRTTIYIVPKREIVKGDLGFRGPSHAAEVISSTGSTIVTVSETESQDQPNLRFRKVQFTSSTNSLKHSLEKRRTTNSKLSDEKENNKNEEEKEKEVRRSLLKSLGLLTSPASNKPELENTFIKPPEEQETETELAEVSYGEDDKSGDNYDKQRQEKESNVNSSGGSKITEEDDENTRDEKAEGKGEVDGDSENDKSDKEEADQGKEEENSVHEDSTNDSEKNETYLKKILKRFNKPS